MSVAPFGPPVATVQGGWYPDPHRRFEYRWHDGSAWTTTVATRGVQSVDPAGAIAALPQLPAWPPQQPTWQQQPGPPQPTWPQHPTAPVQPVGQPPAQPSSAKRAKALGLGLLAVAGVLIVGGAAAAVISPSTDDDPSTNEPVLIDPAPALAPNDPIEWTDELAELSARYAWDNASPVERADMCTTWELSPELARDAFLLGAGAENKELWTAMEGLLATDC